MSYLLVGALQLVLLLLASPVQAYIPVEREPSPRSPDHLRSRSMPASCGR